jgi:hypothetical protein
MLRRPAKPGLEASFQDERSVSQTFRGIAFGDAPQGEGEG